MQPYKNKIFSDINYIVASLIYFFILLILSIILGFCFYYCIYPHIKTSITIRMHMRNNFPNTISTPSKITSSAHQQESNTKKTSYSRKPSNLTQDSSLLDSSTTCEFTPFLFQKPNQDLGSTVTQLPLTSASALVRKVLKHPPPIPHISRQLQEIKTIQILTPIETDVQTQQNLAPTHIPPPPKISLAPLPNYLQKTIRTSRVKRGNKIQRTQLRLSNFRFDSDSSPSPTRENRMGTTVSNINEVNPMLRQRRGPSQYNIASFLETVV